MQPTNIWVDALDFTNKGGWKEDTQFVHLMGSGYLIAAGEPGVPVEDATVEVKIPCSGKYRIWVRDRNWLNMHSPGKFTLLVNGTGNGKVLGELPSNRWVWEIAGDYELEEGTCNIALHDLAGYFGRCASVLLTTDMDYVPSPEIARIHQERAQLKGVCSEVQYGGYYDVIVAGGGPGGVPAAIAAARMGAKVLLIHNRPVLGGNGSSEIGITFDGAGNRHIFARETGIAEEIRRLRDQDPSFAGDWTRAMEKLVAAEDNITVVYHNHVCDVEMDGTTIKSVTTMNIRSLERHKYSGKIFIDCTGDAWLGYYAGAKYRYGREASDEFGENVAPVIADTLTMSGCIKSGNIPFFFDEGKPVEYHAPSWVPKLPETDIEFGRVIKGPRMHWWMEIPNNYDDMWDGEEARDALLLVALGFYDHLKNHWSEKATVENFKMDFVSVAIGRRESRRLVGDYILTQDDCIEGRAFEDGISYTGWVLDVHHPEGIYSGKEGPMYCAKHVHMPQVPYRCLYSKNINNLLFAGRNVSATHIAIGTLRVQNTIATLGQAVGTAAALCLKHEETPRGIYENHLRELQQTLLKNDQYIPGVKNDGQDDPCRTASAKASSVCRTEIMRTEHGTEEKLIPLDVPLSVLGSMLRENPFENVYLKLSSTNEKPTTITVHARTAGDDIDTFSEYGETLTAQAIVPPQTEGWVEVPLKLKIEENPYLDRCYFQIWVEPAEGISWRSVGNLSGNYYRAGKMNESGVWEMKPEKSFRYSVKRPVEKLANCGPDNVINGWSRIVDAENYEWVSDPEETMPQWLELEFAEQTDINSVSVVFDTDLTNPGTCWTSKIPGVPTCVKDYDIEVYDGKLWKKVAQVEGNFMRKRVHCFDTVKTEKIRITVLSTWGDRSARIMEVRAEKAGS